MKDGTSITIRPIRPEDKPLMVRFHQSLSEHSVYFRYFHLIHLNQRIAHERLTRICFIDYDREMALAAGHAGEILAVGRLTRVHGTGDAEFALLVSDNWQNRGLGGELLQRLIDVARREGVERVVAEVSPENAPMIALCRKLGFQLQFTPGE